MRERIRALRDAPGADVRFVQGDERRGARRQCQAALRTRRTQLQASQAETKGELEKRQHAMEQLVRPLKDQLQRVDQQLLTLNKERHESQGMLAQQIVSSLRPTRACDPRPAHWSPRCASPTPAASGGRCSCARSSSWPAWCGTATSTSRRRYAGDDEQALRPDMVVNLPAESTSSSTPRPRSRASWMPMRHPTRRRGRVICRPRATAAAPRQAAGRQALLEQLDSAPDFVVLFLPGEHLYGAALDADPDADRGRDGPDGF